MESTNISKSEEIELDWEKFPRKDSNHETDIVGKTLCKLKLLKRDAIETLLDRLSHNSLTDDQQRRFAVLKPHYFLAKAILLQFGIPFEGSPRRVELMIREEHRRKAEYILR